MAKLRWFVVLVVLAPIAAAFAAPAHAGLLATGPASYCDDSSQPFARWGDRANYMLTPGGSFEESTPLWKLSGGARVVSGNEPFYLNSSRDRKSLYMPEGSTASTPTMCFVPGDWHLRFVMTGNRASDLKVSVTVNSLLGVLSILDGGTVSPTGTWQPSPRVGLLLTNVCGLLTTRAISIRLTAVDGATQVDDVYLDPFKDT